MPEFLDILDNIAGEVRDVRTTFNAREDGVRMSAVRNSRMRDPKYKVKLTEAINLVSDVLKGRRSPLLLQEVMTTDDFPQYFGDILDRTLLAKYQLWVPNWTAFAKRATVRDFRPAKIIPPVYGADGPLDEVHEAAPYPDANLSEQTPIEWRVKKYGRRVPFSWETIINDDLDQLTDIPERLARAARRTEHRLVTQLFVGASGPNTTMYHNNYGNIVNTTNGASTSNPVLSITGLQEALKVFSKMEDETGEPILREYITLVVPPALEVTANNMMNALQIFDSSLLGGGAPGSNGSGDRILQMNNWMARRMNVVVDPYIPRFANSANGDTSWFVFANPGYSREAIRIGFLAGHENPEIWMKSPNAVRVGGGAVSPMSGDFDTDSVEYRIRHVVGVVQVDPKATVMSNGSGT